MNEKHEKLLKDIVRQIDRGNKRINDVAGQQQKGFYKQYTAYELETQRGANAFEYISDLLAEFREQNEGGGL